MSNVLENVLLEDTINQFIKKGYMTPTSDIVIMLINDHNVEKSNKTTYEKLLNKKSDMLYYPLINVDVLFEPIQKKSKEVERKVEYRKKPLFEDEDRRMMAFITDEYVMRTEPVLSLKNPTKKHTFYFYIRIFDPKYMNSYVCRKSFLNYKLFETLRDLGNTCIHLDNYNACMTYITKHKKSVCEMYGISPESTADVIFKETLRILLAAEGIRVRPAADGSLLNVMIIEKL